jgi:hypothetical protein
MLYDTIQDLYDDVLLDQMKSHVIHELLLLLPV